MYLEETSLRSVKNWLIANVPKTLHKQRREFLNEKSGKKRAKNGVAKQANHTNSPDCNLLKIFAA